MDHRHLLPAILCAAAACAADPILSENFDAATKLPAGWNATDPARVTLVEAGAGKALRFTVTEVGNLLVSYRLPLEAVAGKTISYGARVRAEGVSAKPKPWNGVKVQLVITKADGTQGFPGVDSPVGTWDWTTRSGTAQIPADAKAVSIRFGLEGVTGSCQVDDVAVTVVTP